MARAMTLPAVATATRPRHPVGGDDAWRQRAACRSIEPELFFPIGATGQALDQIDAAKQVCAGCPVQVQCLDFALVTNQDNGIWGGRSEDERRTLRRQWLRERRARVLSSS